MDQVFNCGPCSTVHIKTEGPVQYYVLNFDFLDSPVFIDRENMVKIARAVLEEERGLDLSEVLHNLAEELRNG